MGISTGAMVPPGADAVVRVEDTAERDGVVEIGVEVPSGKEVRRAGEDIAAGERVVAPGGRSAPPSWASPRRWAWRRSAAAGGRMCPCS